MDSRFTMPISDARKKIYKISDEVQKPGVRFTLTERGKPRAIFMSYDEYDSMRETLEILSEPGIMNDIKRAEEEYKRGEYFTWEEVKKKLGWERALDETMLLRDKPKSNYKSKKKVK